MASFRTSTVTSGQATVAGQIAGSKTREGCARRWRNPRREGVARHGPPSRRAPRGAPGDESSGERSRGSQGSLPPSSQAERRRARCTCPRRIPRRESAARRGLPSRPAPHVAPGGDSSSGRRRPVAGDSPRWPDMCPTAPCLGVGNIQGRWRTKPAIALGSRSANSRGLCSHRRA